jgi:hypothetical protein
MVTPQARRFAAALEGNKSRASAMVHPVNVGGKESPMGRGILLWLLGVPIPIIILILLFWH